MRGPRVLLLAILLGGAAACGSDAEPVDKGADVGRIDYGSDAGQFAELTRPDGDGPHPVVVVIHGGFWRGGQQFTLRLMDPIVADLTARGYATWNLEYRRVGEPGGGYPGTLADVATGIDHIAEIADEHDLDLERVAVVGHSAGGHLALWSVGRNALTNGSPGASPRLEPSLAIGLAPVGNLARSARDGVGNTAVPDLMGGTPEEVPDRYAVAEPTLLSDSEVVIIHGTNDFIVPRSVIEPAPQPGAAAPHIVEIEGADHFDVIDPLNEPTWSPVIDTLQAWNQS